MHDRGTTGRLYAIKTMHRKRIKLKKAMDLCWNERNIMGRVSSPFIINLKYAFSTKEVTSKDTAGMNEALLSTVVDNQDTLL